MQHRRKLLIECETNFKLWEKKMLFDISYAFDKVRREKIKSNHRLYGSLFDVEHIIQQ